MLGAGYQRIWTHGLTSTIAFDRSVFGALLSFVRLGPGC